VFVSYAHDDNARGASGRGWVSEFVRQLAAAMRQRVGSADVYFDDTHLQANQRLDELKTAARDSAVFLAIASRNYATREWTKRELEAFTSVAEDPHRLFAVELRTLARAKAHPVLAGSIPQQDADPFIAALEAMRRKDTRPGRTSAQSVAAASFRP
jgi:hypothetical protein